MSITLTDILIERAKRHKKYFDNYLTFAKIIKKTAVAELSEARVYLFGSILRKNELARDIDILIISQGFAVPENRTRVLVKIWQELGFGHPFEMHLITPEQYEGWYKYFIKEKVRV